MTREHSHPADPGPATVRAAIRVKPGAARDRVGGSLPAARPGDLPVLLVAVTARPVEGRATLAAERALAAALGLKAQQVKVVRGAASRDKTVELRGVPADFALRWAALAAD